MVSLVSKQLAESGQKERAIDVLFDVSSRHIVLT
jgi:hypothetical protein